MKAKISLTPTQRAVVDLLLAGNKLSGRIILDADGIYVATVGKATFAALHNKKILLVKVITKVRQNPVNGRVEQYGWCQSYLNESLVS